MTTFFKNDKRITTKQTRVRTDGYRALGETLPKIEKAAKTIDESEDSEEPA